MNILAIESSCDETAAAVVADGRDVRSNVVSSQIDIHRATGGVVPEVAARLQLEAIPEVIRKALADAGATWDDLDAIAVTEGPGLMGPLLVGTETAKALAYAKDLPLIGVHHLAGHLYAALATEEPFAFPYLGLVVSGGHTELVVMREHHRFELVGSTRDDAAGEAFDKVGKLLGLPYPGGPEISRLAGRGDPAAIDFPRAMLDQDNFDFSFSGLKTAARRAVADGRSVGRHLADVAASFQAAVVDVLVKKTVRAAHAVKPSAVLLGGGVAANEALRASLAAALHQQAYRLLVSPRELATDNAAMIGIAAFWKADDALHRKRRFALRPDPASALAD